MSLKAKLEAVVYAAEEPVTLAQLTAIFSEEVLQGLGEEAEPGTEQIALVGSTPEAAGPTPETAGPTPETAGPVATPEAPDSEEPPAPVEPSAPEDPSVATAAAEGDEKKSARQRDRRVRQALQVVLDELIADYANSERGMEIREIAGGYRMATKPEYHDAVRGFVKSLKPPMKLSLQALETLAVIAYKQPVTAPEVSEIRGVDSGGVLGGLVSRKLITTAGRKQVIGRPILYKTTKEFLLRFGLKDVNDLPSMEEFEKMAGELAESEAEGEVQDANMHSSEVEGEAQDAGMPSSEEHASLPEAESSHEAEASHEAESSAEAESSHEGESSAEAGAEERELTPSGGAGEPTPVAES
jgi:segregation and condensation protein B